MKFYDRKEEMELLRRNERQSREHATFTVLMGRRRIGKTTLLTHVFSGKGMVYLFVSRDSEALLCRKFQRALEEQIGLSVYGDVTRFRDLFEIIMKESVRRHFTVVIDEFQGLYRVIREYPERQVQTKIIRHEHNRGLAAARNTAVAAASGKFLFHLDSDDWIETNTIEIMVAKQEETKADIISVDSVINDREIDDRYVEPRYRSKQEMLICCLTQMWHHEIHGRLIRLSLYIESHITCLEGFNQAEDWRVLPRLVWYAKKLAWVRRGMYHYVMNDNSYCRSEKTPEQLISTCYQAYINEKSIWEFFKDRDKHLFDVSQKYVIQLCYDLLLLYLSHKQKQEFSQLRKSLLENYSLRIQFSKLGPKVTSVLHMPFCYHVLPIYLQLQNWTYKLRGRK